LASLNAFYFGWRRFEGWNVLETKYDKKLEEDLLVCFENNTPTKKTQHTFFFRLALKN
jgi:hypothetical protein